MAIYGEFSHYKMVIFHTYVTVYQRVNPIKYQGLSSGWWFGTLSSFPYIGNSHLNWLIFFRGWNHQPVYPGLSCSNDLNGAQWLAIRPGCQKTQVRARHRSRSSTRTGRWGCRWEETSRHDDLLVSIGGSTVFNGDSMVISWWFHGDTVPTNSTG